MRRGFLSSVVSDSNAMVSNEFLLFAEEKPIGHSFATSKKAPQSRSSRSHLLARSDYCGGDRRCATLIAKNEPLAPDLFCGQIVTYLRKGPRKCTKDD
jgi:hypothetical protein